MNNGANGFVFPWFFSPDCEGLIPNRYTREEANILTCQLLENGGVVEFGRALYPRYFATGERVIEWWKNILRAAQPFI